MERNPSRIQTACWVVALLGVLLSGYVGTYVWRLQQTYLITTLSTIDGYETEEETVYFQTDFEEHLFWPLAEVHKRISLESFRAPARWNFARDALAPLPASMR